MFGQNTVKLLLCVRPYFHVFTILNIFTKTLFLQFDLSSSIILLWKIIVVVVVWRINVDLAIFQPYLDLEAGDNQSLKIQVARPAIEPRSSCSASQELNHSATAAPWKIIGKDLILVSLWPRK